MDTTTTSTTNLLQTNGHPESRTSETFARIKLSQSNASLAANNRKQFSSFILFLSVIILVNLCPFQSDFEPTYSSSDREQQQQVTSPAHSQQHSTTTSREQMTAKQFGKTPSSSSSSSSWWPPQHTLVGHVETCLEFVKLMFKSPMRLGKRTTRFTLAEARVLGKMAKVWYIKKKIKKLSKKLKKHTIAVPVFTAIPIYEHSYYPQPHVTHVTHGAGLHHAASSFSPTLAQVAAAASTSSGSAATGAAGQQMATSASNNHHLATYRMAPAATGPPAHHQGAGLYHHHHHHQSHPGQIINAYAPSPALYVDESGGLYGTYGNAYGRYDGGYHYW